MKTNMLSNKYVIYGILIISVFTILGYLANRDFDSLTLFLAVYLLTCYFTKKTAIRLLAALLVTVFLGRPNKRHWPWMEREGLKNKEGNTHEENEEENENKKSQDMIEKLGNLSNNEGIKDMLSKSGLNGANNMEGLQQINPKDLEKHMKSMEPLVKSAQKLLDTFENSGILNMLDKVTPLLGKALPRQS